MFFVGFRFSQLIKGQKLLQFLYLSDALFSLQAIGGNIMTASPISDLNPVLMASGSKLTLVSKGKLHFPVALRGVG